MARARMSACRAMITSTASTTVAKPPAPSGTSRMLTSRARYAIPVAKKGATWPPLTATETGAIPTPAKTATGRRRTTA